MNVERSAYSWLLMPIINLARRGKKVVLAML